MKEDKGLRFNEGKSRHDLIPSFAQAEYAKILTKGSEKYAPRNWENGMKWSKVIASLKRHLHAMESGEDFDPESGCLHSAHVMCNAAFLTEYYKIHPEGDDRPHSYLNQKKIYLDIDEVLCKWSSAWCQKWSIPTQTSWYFDRQIVQRFEEMKSNNELDEFYLNLEVLTKPEEIPFEPAGYVTARPVSAEITEAWLDTNGFPHRPVHNVGLRNSKADVLKELDCDIFVDDRFDNFVELNKAGICTFLFDAPHNQRYDVGYKRIKSLKELTK